MKKSALVPALAFAILTPCAPDISRMESEFQTPPQEARPRVWWHWEDGNVTVDGIRKDPDWMKRIGIGGFHHFDASVQMDPVVEKRLIYMDEGWKEAFKAEISGLLKAGENAIEARVTNVWVNRLIGDRQPDCPKVTTYSSRAFYNADGRTVPAGLIGPVVLISE